MILRLAKRAIRPFVGSTGFEAASYWEGRYATGGTSGDGSYGRLAEFKAATLNAFISEHGVASAIEFGCGDGNQLSLIEYPAYIGLDVSSSAVQRCIARFGEDDTKNFFLYDPACFRDPGALFRADAAISLDVIYHITEDRKFDLYMRQLCEAARRFVIVYSTNFDAPSTGHVRHREFGRWMAARQPELRLTDVIQNPFPGEGPQESNASFWFFERTDGA